MANSGGGAVVFGVQNDGQPAKRTADLEAVLELDPAKITDQLASYTGQHFSDFEVVAIKRGRSRAAVIEVGPASMPLVFAKPGNYPNPKRPDRELTAFSQGTIYFRHGAKSEPATAGDISSFIEARLDTIREKWLGGIRRVITAPPGAEMRQIEFVASDAEGKPTEIRLTGDPSALVFGKLDPDKIHPYRQKELVDEVNRRLPRNQSINKYDIECVRAVHHVTPVQKPNFAHQPKYGSMQFSDAFADWLATKGPDFFDHARERYYQLKHG